MRILAFCLILLFASTAVFAFDDHEYAPIEEKDIEYKNWKYENVVTGDKTSLRKFAKDKKLVLVFYWAHWCHSSNYQAPITEKLYQKYKDDGFAVIGVSLYGTESSTRNKIRWLELTFPTVVESTSTEDRLTSQHYKYRTATGDTRKWATPWNIFLEPAKFEEKGDVLVHKAAVANGELTEEAAEDFIREKLGLPKLEREGEKGQF
ncbi:MAG: redoxin domain-containing protein [Pyrinomonadaceae bacterium]